MSEHPHGVWIWLLSGLGSDSLDRLVEHDVRRVYLKVFDGQSDPPFWSGQCTPQIIEQFHARQIQVYGWGVHYGAADADAEIAALQQALDCGLDGYVVQLGSDVENPAVHPQLERLLAGLRPLVPPGGLGYATFAHPGFHPQVPWHTLDQLCDLAFPQLDFEAFSFRPTNEQEVQACLDAQRRAGLTRPALPVWSSAPGAARPASASELQHYLRRFPGSSIWRLPHLGERGGQAWNLSYGDQPLVPTGPAQPSPLPPLTRRLLQRVQGADVAALQRALNELGFPAGPVDGDFGPRTEAAVRAFQRQAGITIDGIVGPQTWEALGGAFDTVQPPGETGVRLRLADVAQAEAAKRLRWTGPDCEAEQYLQPLREPMQSIHHIGAAAVFYNWCAAFVYWCCGKVGIQVPAIPDGFWATMALVESWKYWAQRQGYWFPRDSIVPQRGDILVFDWFNGGPGLDHIGIVAGYTAGSSVIHTYEGNTGNQAAAKTRELSTVPGFIRIASE